MDILKAVERIFREVFDDESLVITNEINSGDIDDWDSLMHIRLVVSIEKEFSIKFAFEELQKLENVGEMVGLIKNKLLSEKN